MIQEQHSIELIECRYEEEEILISEENFFFFLKLVDCICSKLPQ